ncbi:MAG: sugar transferase [Bacteroidota bacterium]|nr:sugar transferase [Bacteroidota bacterium]
MKRLFDIIFSFFGLILLLPLFIVLIIWVFMDSRGGAFYKQVRVGRNNKDFNLHKFRTMVLGSDQQGLLTIGETDKRITGAGKFLRKYKLDELPQLFNILIGEMSFIGPRPEVRKFVDLYTPEQEAVLKVRPGLTDYASMKYIDENKLLGESDNPEKTYIEVIMPAKLALNQKYIQEQSLGTDIKILKKTIRGIFF